MPALLFPSLVTRASYQRTPSSGRWPRAAPVPRVSVAAQCASIVGDVAAARQEGLLAQAGPASWVRPRREGVPAHCPGRPFIGPLGRKDCPQTIQTDTHEATGCVDEDL